MPNAVVDTGLRCGLDQMQAGTCGLPAIKYMPDDERAWWIVGGILVGGLVSLLIGACVWWYVLRRQKKAFAATRAKRTELEKLLAKEYDVSMYVAQDVDVNKPQASALADALRAAEEEEAKSQVSAATGSTAVLPRSGDIVRDVRAEVEATALKGAERRGGGLGFSDRLAERPAREHFVRAHFYQSEPKQPRGFQWARHDDAVMDLTAAPKRPIKASPSADHPPLVPGLDPVLHPEMDKASLHNANSVGLDEELPVSERLPLFSSHQLLHVLLTPPLAEHDRQTAALAANEKAQLAPLSMELENEADRIARGMVMTAKQQMDSFEYFHTQHAAQSHTNIGNVARLHLTEHVQVLQEHEDKSTELIEAHRTKLKAEAEDKIRTKTADEARRIIAEVDQKLAETAAELAAQSRAQRQHLKKVQAERGQSLDDTLAKAHASGLKDLLLQAHDQMADTDVVLAGIGVVTADNPRLKKARQALQVQLESTLISLRDLCVLQVDTFAKGLSEVRQLYAAKYAEAQMALAEAEYNAVQAHEHKFADMMKTQYAKLADDVERAKSQGVSDREMATLLQLSQRNLNQYGRNVAAQKQAEADELRLQLKRQRQTRERQLHEQHDRDLHECRAQTYAISLQNFVDVLLQKIQTDLMDEHEVYHNSELDKRYRAFDRELKQKKASGATDEELAPFVEAKQKELNEFAVALQRAKDEDASKVNEKLHEIRRTKEMLLETMLKKYYEQAHIKARSAVQSAASSPPPARVADLPNTVPND